MLILFKEARSDQPSTPEQVAEMAESGMTPGLFAAYLRDHGIAVEDGQILDDHATARTLRPRSGEILVTDGPYGGKEFLGGYYVIAAQDLDAALEAARHCPMYAGIEVRPVWELPQ